MFFEVAGKFEKASVYCNEDGFSKRIPVDKDIFADVLFCGDCGRKMKRLTAVKELSVKGKVRAYGYNCPNVLRIDEDNCISKNITLKCLSGIVKEAIKQEFSLSQMRPKDMVESNNREAERIKKEWNEELLELEKQIANIKRIGSEQYLKYRMGEMEAAHFKQEKEENERKIAVCQNRKAEIEDKLRTIDYETVQKNHFLRVLAKGNEKSELTEEVVKTLIHRFRASGGAENA